MRSSRKRLRWDSGVVGGPCLAAHVAHSCTMPTRTNNNNTGAAATSRALVNTTGTSGNTVSNAQSNDISPPTGEEAVPSVPNTASTAGGHCSSNCAASPTTAACESMICAWQCAGRRKKLSSLSMRTNSDDKLTFVSDVRSDTRPRSRMFPLTRKLQPAATTATQQRYMAWCRHIHNITCTNPATAVKATNDTRAATADKLTLAQDWQAPANMPQPSAQTVHIGPAKPSAQPSSSMNADEFAVQTPPDESLVAASPSLVPFAAPTEAARTAPALAPLHALGSGQAWKSSDRGDTRQ